MNPIAQELIDGCQTAANKPAAIVAGVSGALRLLASWVLSIEARLERLEGNR